MRRRRDALAAGSVEPFDAEARRQRADAAAAMAFAKAVYDARTAAGWSEAELAARAGLVEDDIVCAEESGTVPTPELLERLARALDSDVTLTWSATGVTARFERRAA
ncbi:MAG: XRE family transcriptional regulator [Streptomycetaceae bacterium]|jgi:ribosome-binding protein aMBF1 (putative translation factor)|nr:XRE family transcriptional regulator [Streptomycetaceae bacterium]